MNFFFHESSFALQQLALKSKRNYFNLKTHQSAQNECEHSVTLIVSNQKKVLIISFK